MLALVLIAGVLSAGVAAGVTVGVLHLQAKTNPQTVDLGSRVTITEQNAVEQVAAKALRAVVTVVTQNRGASPTYGSGFLVTSDGEVVTNVDLVAHASNFTILIRGDTKARSARLLDFDCATGVAVLKMESVSNLPTLSFGSSSALKPGQTVIALAGPLSEHQAVTRGIVSALGATMTISDPIKGAGTQSFSDTIQTDAGIGPASSGGPLLNVDGQVVGVDLAGTASGQPVGAALAANDVQPDVQQIVQNGQLVVPILGVDGTELSSAAAALRNLPPGMLVQTVDAGSPAEQVGIKAGDVITQLDDVTVGQTSPLAGVLRARFHPSQRVSVTLSRNGSATQVPVTLGGGHPACA